MQIRHILGDQLNSKISSLKGIDKAHDVVLLCEVVDEARYVKHHKKKIALLFSAMRHFAKELKAKGYRVDYRQLDDPDNSGSFRGELQRAVKHYQADGIVVTEPSEYRVMDDFKTGDFGVPVEIRADDRFLCSHDEFAEWARGRKQLRMEYFYRDMRKQYGILMDGEQPEGGQWNYDSDNRNPLKHGLDIPVTYTTKPDAITREVMTLVTERFADHFGDLEPFHLAVTRRQALRALRQFIDERLRHFGDYQDAMLQGEPWLYHSHISFYINCGLLLPLECVEAAEQAYYQGHAPLNAVEGFIRQIIGWREYVRGIYWLKMPDYAESNFLNAKRPLPEWFWSGDTEMNCLKQCITETRQHAYAHHIQRLMVLGNFALLAGLAPDAVNEWYLIVYADAYQWVELPNVSGMILFADGGLLGSKPYAASGAYINKMSDYCQSCHYKVKQKNGKDACPFNYLYWDFLMRNEKKLRSNPRLSMIYRTLQRMGPDKASAIKDDSRRFFKAIQDGQKV